MRGPEGIQELLQGKSDNVSAGFQEGRLGVYYILDLASLTGRQMK